MEENISSKMNHSVKRLVFLCLGLIIMAFGVGVQRSIQLSYDRR